MSYRPTVLSTMSKPLVEEWVAIGADEFPLIAIEGVSAGLSHGRDRVPSRTGDKGLFGVGAFRAEEISRAFVQKDMQALESSSPNGHY